VPSPFEIAIIKDDQEVFMRLGIFDLFTLLGFGLWFLFPAGIYIATRRLYHNTDQAYQFKRNFGEEFSPEAEDAEVLPLTPDEFKTSKDEYRKAS
jgi:hypothetical protein